MAKYQLILTRTAGEETFLKCGQTDEETENKGLLQSS